MKQEINFEDLYDIKTVSSGIFSTLQTAKSLKTMDKLYTIKTLEVTSVKPENLIRAEIKLWEKLKTMEFKPKAIPLFNGFAKGKQKNQFNLIFDIPSKNLKETIDELKIKNTVDPFPFEQLKSFFESLVKTFAFLQTMKICQQDLKPCNLLLDQNINQIYIIDLAVSKDNIIKANADLKKEFTISGSSSYFPPELDNAQNNPSIEIDIHKADVFSLALIFLELGTSQVPSKIYGAAHWKEEIDNLIKRFKEIYKNTVQSPEAKRNLEEFVKVLRNCLVFIPDERPDFIELFLGTMRNCENERLRMHILLEEEILNLEHLRNLENLRGKDFSFMGASKDNQVDVKIWGKAANFIDRDSFVDEE